MASSIFPEGGGNNEDQYGDKTNNFVKRKLPASSSRYPERSRRMERGWGEVKNKFNESINPCNTKRTIV